MGKKEGPCAHNAPPRPSPTAPGLGGGHAVQGTDRCLVGGPDGGLRAERKALGGSTVLLSGRDANMGIWVPDAVLDTHLALHSPRHRCHMITPSLETEQTESETVNSRLQSH